MKILALGFTSAEFFKTDVKQEAESRGYEMDICSVSSLTADVSNTGVDIRSGELNLFEYDLIHVGALSKNRWPTIAILDYLHRKNNCTILDRRLIDLTLGQFSGLSKYFLEYENGINLPHSIQFKKVEEIKNRLSPFEFPVIIKTNSSRLGKGVGLAHDYQGIVDFVAEKEQNKKGTGYILREKIPNDGDYRVNVIDGKAIMCLKRTPKAGEYRSNISLGGTLTDAGLENTKEVCAVAEKIVRLANYDIAGVDVMVHEETGVPYILEVNRAPGGLEDDAEVSGINLAKIIVDLYEKRISQK